MEKYRDSLCSGGGSSSREMGCCLDYYTSGVSRMSGVVRGAEVSRGILKFEILSETGWCSPLLRLLRLLFLGFATGAEEEPEKKKKTLSKRLLLLLLLPQIVYGIVVFYFSGVECITIIITIVESRVELGLLPESEVTNQILLPSSFFLLLCLLVFLFWRWKILHRSPPPSEATLFLVFKSI